MRSNQRLRNQLEEGRTLFKKLVKENDRFRQRLSDINSQDSVITSLKAKLASAARLFEANPKKVFPNMPTTVIIYLKEQGMYQDFCNWYTSKYQKFKSQQNS